MSFGPAGLGDDWVAFKHDDDGASLETDPGGIGLDDPRIRDEQRQAFGDYTAKERGFFCSDFAVVHRTEPTNTSPFSPSLSLNSQTLSPIDCRPSSPPLACLE